MPNSFSPLDVPLVDGPGVPLITSAFGRQKTIGFSGAGVKGRYVVEGSNDGGNTWDILIDDDGAQALFTSGSPGLRNFDCIVDRVRVRSINNGRVTTPPVVSIGAPPLTSTPIFGVLDVPAASGPGPPFDLGLSAGPFKTFILRGAIAPGSRYTISGSIDGERFDEALLFTADQQGTQSIDVLCRFLRVDRAGVGATPVIAFGSEGTLEPGQPAAMLSIAEAAKISTTSLTDEELLHQYRVPLTLLGQPSLRVTLVGDAAPPSEARQVTFNVRAGGSPDLPDGTLLLAVPHDASGGLVVGTSAPFVRPTEPATLIKVTAQGDGVVPAILSHFCISFHSP
jgi:hypothetical protein